MSLSAFPFFGVQTSNFPIFRGDLLLVLGYIPWAQKHMAHVTFKSIWRPKVKFKDSCISAGKQWPSVTGPGELRSFGWPWVDAKLGLRVLLGLLDLSEWSLVISTKPSLKDIFWGAFTRLLRNMTSKVSTATKKGGTNLSANGPTWSNIQHVLARTIPSLILQGGATFACNTPQHTSGPGLRRRLRRCEACPQ